MSNNNRSAVKPNSTRRMAIRYSLAGLSCMTCGLSVCWSRETSEHAPHAAQQGHVIGANIGGTYAAGNIGAQCNACNDAARDAGQDDLTGQVIPENVPARYVPTRLAQGRADVRDCAPLHDAPDADARRAARARRGLAW